MLECSEEGCQVYHDARLPTKTAGSFDQKQRKAKQMRKIKKEVKPSKQNDCAGRTTDGGLGMLRSIPNI